MKEKCSNFVSALQAQGYNDIVFYQPALNIGGGSLVEANLAKCIADNTSMTVWFCDYPGGYGAFNCVDNPKVKLLNFKESDVNFPLQKKCILFTNSTRVILLKNMHPESKILFWHYETVKCGWDSVLIQGETKNYLRLVKDNNSMCYHDWSARDSLNRYCGTGFTNSDFIFIPLETKQNRCSPSYVQEDTINLGFLSRLAIDKVCALYYLVQNFAEYKTEKKKVLHVIGDGVKAEEAKRICKEYSEKIEFVFTGTIAHEDLDDYLTRNIDLLFGLGTSVLEGAALRIPCAPLIIDIKRFEDTDAWWLFDTRDYCVGILKEQKEDFEKTGAKFTPINTMIDEVYSEGGKEKYGELCYEYYLKNHSSYTECMMNFFRFAAKSTLTFAKILGCIKFVPYNLLKITSFKVLGIPLKKIEHGGFMKIVFSKCRYLQLFKRVTIGRIRKYYILRLKVLTLNVTRVPYSFPVTKRDDRHIYMSKTIKQEEVK